MSDACPECGTDLSGSDTCKSCGYTVDVATTESLSVEQRIEAVETAIVTLARSRFFDGKYANETLDNQLQHTARVQQKAVRQKAEELRANLQTTS